MSEPMNQWIEAERRHAAREMQRAISPVDIVKERPGFGQTVRGARGAVIASPVLASWDPEPDYFFHWFRDSAIILDALRLLHRDGLANDAPRDIVDFTHFTARLADLDGQRLVDAPGWRQRVVPDFVKFLRTDEDLSAVRGDAVYAETRVNPDGTLDISSWTRPQHDGSASRVLTLLRWLAAHRFEIADRDAIASLLRSDLAFVAKHWALPCYDIWEEENGFHFYTLRVSAAALRQGARWLAGEGDEAAARHCRAAAAEADAMLATLLADGHYVSRRLASGKASAKQLDIAIILAAIHVADEEPEAMDAPMLETLDRLEQIFAADYPINRGRPAGHGPAMGRYRGDVYFSGGAYYFSTFGAAELCFRAARLRGDRGFFERGEAFLRTARAFTPPSGDLSEQFDQTGGAQSSARHLAWSYAAFLTAAEARRLAIGALTR